MNWTMQRYGKSLPLSSFRKLLVQPYVHLQKHPVMAIPIVEFSDILSPMQIQKLWNMYHGMESEPCLDTGELQGVYDLKFLVRLLNLWCNSVDNKIEMDVVAHGKNTSYSKELRKMRAYTYKEFQYLFNPHVAEKDFIHLPPFHDFLIKKEAQRYAVASTFDKSMESYVSALSEKYTPLLSFFFKQLDSKIPYSLIIHMWLTAPTRWGKTEFLKTIFYSLQSHTQNNNGATLIIIDVHGDVSKEIKKFALNQKKERFVFVSPSFYDDIRRRKTYATEAEKEEDAKRQYVCRMNPLDLKGLDDFERDQVRDDFVTVLSEAIDDRRGADLTSNMTVILQRSIGFLLNREHSTLTDLVKLLGLNPKLIEEAKEYSEYFGTQFAETDKMTREAILKRMERLTESTALTNMLFGQSTFDLEAAIESGKVIVFDISKCTDLIMPIAGKFIFSTIRAIYRKRNKIDKSKRKKGYLFLDECQNFATRTLNLVLEEMGKFNLSIILSHQHTSQMSDHLDSLRANCNIKIFGGDNVQTRAKEMEISLGTLDSLKKYEFCLKAGHLPIQKFKSSDVLIKDYKYQLTDLQESLLDEYLLKTYYKLLTKEEIKKDDKVLRPDLNLEGRYGLWSNDYPKDN